MGGGKQQRQARAGRRDHLTWLNSYPKASAWMARHDAAAALQAGQGIAKISGLLPAHVAEGVLQDLLGLPASDWNATEGQADYTHNNISHSFQSIRHAPCLERVVRVLSLLLPYDLHSFSAARYLASDHIEPHDDRAYTQVRLVEDGRVELCSRHVALIFYLTKGWRRDWGGLLVDLEAPGGPRTYVPEFNSAILFRIPRWHEVTRMADDAPPRFTVFGWFLLPGKRYKLGAGSPPARGDEAPAGAQAGHAGRQELSTRSTGVGDFDRGGSANHLKPSTNDTELLLSAHAMRLAQRKHRRKRGRLVAHSIVKARGFPIYLGALKGVQLLRAVKRGRAAGHALRRG